MGQHIFWRPNTFGNNKQLLGQIVEIMKHLPLTDVTSVVETNQVLKGNLFGEKSNINLHRKWIFHWQFHIVFPPANIGLLICWIFEARPNVFKCQVETLETTSWNLWLRDLIFVGTQCFFQKCPPLFRSRSLLHLEIFFFLLIISTRKFF